MRTPRLAACLVIAVGFAACGGVVEMGGSTHDISDVPDAGAGGSKGLAGGSGGGRPGTGGGGGTGGYRDVGGNWGGVGGYWNTGGYQGVGGATGIGGGGYWGLGGYWGVGGYWGLGGATGVGGAPMCYVDFPCQYNETLVCTGPTTYQRLQTHDCHYSCGPGPCSGASCDVVGPQYQCPPGQWCVSAYWPNQCVGPWDAGVDVWVPPIYDAGLGE